MKNAVLNHLDAPLSIAGIPFLRFVEVFASLFVGLFFFGSFLAVLGGIALFIVGRKILGRFPPFFLPRLLYRSFPKIVFRRLGKNLIESHITEWIK